MFSPGWMIVYSFRRVIESLTRFDRADFSAEPPLSPLPVRQRACQRGPVRRVQTRFTVCTWRAGLRSRRAMTDGERAAPLPGPDARRRHLLLLPVLAFVELPTQVVEIPSTLPAGRRQGGLD